MEQRVSLNFYLNEFQDCHFYLIHQNSLSSFLDSLPSSSKAYEVDVAKFIQSLTSSSLQKIQHLTLSEFRCFIEPVSRGQLSRMLGGLPL